MNRPVACVALIAWWLSPSATARAARPTMVKRVTEQSSFALYLPQGWRAGESATDKYRTLTVSDPQGQRHVVLSVGLAPVLGDAVGVARSLLAQIAASCPGLRVTQARVAQDRARLVFDGAYGAGAGAREFRAWVSVRQMEFTYASITAPQGQLQAHKTLLLTILSFSLQSGAWWALAGILGVCGVLLVLSAYFYRGIERKWGGASFL